jgi:hypothetical protein
MSYRPSIMIKYIGLPGTCADAPAVSPPLPSVTDSHAEATLDATAVQISLGAKTPQPSRRTCVLCAALPGILREMQDQMHVH